MLLLSPLSAVSDMAGAHVAAFALLSCWHVLLLWLLPPLPAVAAVAVAVVVASMVANFCWQC